MENLVRCGCGHTVDEHGGTGCKQAPCICRRDRFDALESALNEAAEEYPWYKPRPRAVAGSTNS